MREADGLTESMEKMSVDEAADRLSRRAALTRRVPPTERRKQANAERSVLTKQALSPMQSGLIGAGVGGLGGYLTSEDEEEGGTPFHSTLRGAMLGAGLGGLGHLGYDAYQQHQQGAEDTGDLRGKHKREKDWEAAKEHFQDVAPWAGGAGAAGAAGHYASKLNPATSKGRRVLLETAEGRDILRKGARRMATKGDISENVARRIMDNPARVMNEFSTDTGRWVANMAREGAAEQYSRFNPGKNPITGGKLRKTLRGTPYATGTRGLGKLLAKTPRRLVPLVGAGAGLYAGGSYLGNLARGGYGTASDFLSGVGENAYNALFGASGGGGGQ